VLWISDVCVVQGEYIQGREHGGGGHMGHRSEETGEILTIWWHWPDVSGTLA